MKEKSLSRVQLFVTLWTVAHQAPSSVGFPRQAYWNGLPFSSPGDLPDPGIELRSLALQAYSLPSESPGNPIYEILPYIKYVYSSYIYYIYIYILFQILFNYRLLQDTEYSFLCYTLGSCCLSILYIVVCSCESPIPNLSLPPPLCYPFGNHDFFSL